MIHSIKIDGFRGLKFEDNDVRRVNLIIGENNTGKTSFLEAIFFSTLLLSNKITFSEANSQLLYMLSSRGESLSAFSTINDSTITVNDDKIIIKRKDPFRMSVYLNDVDESKLIAKIEVEKVPISWGKLTGFLQIPSLVQRNTIKELDYFPVYISVHFDSYDNPERIISYSKKRGGKSEFEILKDDYDQFYQLLPVYSIGRGFLKKELIKASLSYANILLVDEIEDSLHPNYVKEVLKNIVDAKNVQSFITTHSNEVVKMLAKLTQEENELAIYYFSPKKAYRKYSLSELANFDSPLSWAGYV
ncbi:hypothetical protein SJAV_01330 [Sulfurisphaera javensis]|uniref:ATPase AAA-type core domain-containing protein n=1 Tax=Sulfurisphaera javensis TaxID=2049879 RepID=A0AAT9GMS1_9CREN